VSILPVGFNVKSEAYLSVSSSFPHGCSSGGFAGQRLYRWYEEEPDPAAPLSLALIAAGHDPAMEAIARALQRLNSVAKMRVAIPKIGHSPGIPVHSPNIA
jgi:hypothetical protein